MQPSRPPVLPEASTRLLLPATRRELPRWEVGFQGRVIGWIQERHHHAVVFFEAIGIHPITGDELSLQINTDWDERVEVVRRFWLDPLSSQQHLDWKHRRLHDLV